MSKSVESTRRELFEAWTKKQDKLKIPLHRFVNLPVVYSDPETAITWLAFNAALDAVEIDLEPAIRTRGGGPIDGSMYTSEVYKAIESLNLGIKIRT